jgi:hypothetical protein
MHDDVDQYDNINLNSIGRNIKTEWNKKEVNGDWTDVEMYEKISSAIPWAEQCYPLFGESGNFRYYKDGKIATISDSNYSKAWTYDKNQSKVGQLAFKKADAEALDAFRINDTNSPSEPTNMMNTNISVSPAFWYETTDHKVYDLFSSPDVSFGLKANPYTLQYTPSKHDNKSKGIFGIPQIGSKVWVFHYEGDLNFPVYFGVTEKSNRELSIINQTDNTSSIGKSYPMDFEN